MSNFLFNAVCPTMGQGVTYHRYAFVGRGIEEVNKTCFEKLGVRPLGKGFITNSMFEWNIGLPWTASTVLGR